MNKIINNSIGLILTLLFFLVGHLRAGKTRSSPVVDRTLCCWQSCECLFLKTQCGHNVNCCAAFSCKCAHPGNTRILSFLKKSNNTRSQAPFLALRGLKRSPSVTLCPQIKRLHDGPSAAPQTGQHQRQIRWPNGRMLLAPLYHPSGSHGSGQSRRGSRGPLCARRGRAQLW